MWKFKRYSKSLSMVTRALLQTNRFAKLIIVVLSLAIFFPLAMEIRAADLEVFPGSKPLRINLPPGWVAVPSTVGSVHRTVLHYVKEPRIEVSLSQMSNWPGHIPILLGLPFECDLVLSPFRQRPSTLVPRPHYFPPEFYSRVLEPLVSLDGGTPRIEACLFLGNSDVAVEVTPPPPDTRFPALTEMLQAIVAAAKQQSTLRYAPGRISPASLKCHRLSECRPLGC
jgi:hypothetical protein